MSDGDQPASRLAWELPGGESVTEDPAVAAEAWANEARRLAASEFQLQSDFLEYKTAELSRRDKRVRLEHVAGVTSIKTKHVSSVDAVTGHFTGVWVHMMDGFTYQVQPPPILKPKPESFSGTDEQWKAHDKSWANPPEETWERVCKLLDMET